jgi:hypothetical protein
MNSGPVQSTALIIINYTYQITCCNLVVRLFPFPAFLLEHDVTPQQFFIIFRFVKTRFFAAEGTMHECKCTYEIQKNELKIAITI